MLNAEAFIQQVSTAQLLLPQVAGETDALNI
jgi:hypothetical protein